MASSVRTTGFQRLAVGTAVAALVLVAIGGAVRATDSGLACPTWPGCFSAGDFLPPADLHVWLEHTHRLVAGVVAILVTIQAIWAIARYRNAPWVVWPAVVAAVAVLVQAALGALVVLHLLRAELVTAHLGMGMLVVGCLVLIAVNASRAPGSAATADRRFARTSAAVAAVTLLQILVGGHLTGVGGGLAFTGRGFPFFGVATFAPVETAREAYNVAHRLLAVVLVVGVVVLVVVARRTHQQGWLRRLPTLTAGLIVLQIAIGVGNLATELSFLTVIPHLAVASWIWAALVLTTVLAYHALAHAPHSPAATPDRPAETVGAR